MTFWSRSYIPAPGADRLRRHGDYAATRERYFGRPHSNLRFLVHERYAWMKPYLAGRGRVVELGAGPGLSRDVLESPGLELTDVLANPLVDRRVDAVALPYEPASLDAVICSHMIHHVAAPVALIRAIERARSRAGCCSSTRRRPVPWIWEAHSLATRYVLQVGTLTGQSQVLDRDVGYRTNYTTVVVPHSYVGRVLKDNVSSLGQAGGEQRVNAT